MAAWGGIVVSGCWHAPREVHHKSLEELYNDAMATTAQLPEKTYAADTAGEPLPEFRPASEPATAAPPMPAAAAPAEVQSPQAVLAPPPPTPTTSPGEMMSVPNVETAPVPPGDDNRSTLRRLPGRNGRGTPPVRAAGFFRGAAVGQDVPRVSETFEQSDIREALRLIGASAGVNIVVDEQVRGSATATFENVPLEDALDAVLLPLGLVSARHGNQYVVGPPDPNAATFPALAEHREYETTHQTPGELLGSLPKKLQVFARAVEKRNLIVIDAPRAIGEDIVRRLKQVDRPVPQVILEAIVCVISPDSALHFGSDMGHQVPGGSSGNAMEMGFSSLTFSGTFSRYGFDHATDDFSTITAFVKLLAQEGYLSIRASPRVMAKDGEKAQIAISRESFFSPQQSATQNGSGIYFPTNIQKVESGITLNITPIVRGDTVTVQIEKAEVSEDITSGNTSLPATNSQSPYPIVNRRTVSTTVHVKDGHTIVIGGLVQKQTVEQVSRVPGLSRIPWVGRLFQTVERQEREAEVVILISPRIVTPTPVVAAVPPPSPKVLK